MQSEAYCTHETFFKKKKNQESNQVLRSNPNLEVI